ncbi:hypothetical protein D7Y13_20945 [Corallococcus praedator]|uniref:Serine/threonine protein kinase n=1 Tax=Corallococcus praedator TaxID=2316724 RepID=A0ABX9QFF2_9BACT|nr:hypothetical protein D7Y13_20945 [Corallococcus praedator]
MAAVSAMFALAGCQHDVAPSESGAARIVISGPRVAPVSPDVAPRITSAFQTARTIGPGHSARVNVRATDPEDTTLRYVWEATVGTLGKPRALSDGSEALWTAPACVAAQQTPVVHVRVTNAAGLETRQSFTLSWTGPTCPPGKEHRSRVPNASVQLALGSNPGGTARVGSERPLPEDVP